MFVQCIVFLEFSQMKQLQIFGISVLGVFVLLFGQQAFAADADRITKCDQLAAHPDDSYRTSEGVHTELLSKVESDPISLDTELA